MSEQFSTSGFGRKAIWRKASDVEDEWARSELEQLRSGIRKMRRLVGFLFFAVTTAMGLAITIFGERDPFVISVGVGFMLLGLPFLYVGLVLQKDSFLYKLVPSSNLVLEVQIPIEQKWYVEPDSSGISGVLLRSTCDRSILFFGRGYRGDGTVEGGGVFPGQLLSVLHYFVDYPKKRAPILGLHQSKQLCVVVSGNAGQMESIADAECSPDMEFMYNPLGPSIVDGNCVYMCNAELGSLTRDEVLDSFSITEVQQDIE